MASKADKLEDFSEWRHKWVAFHPSATMYEAQLDAYLAGQEAEKRKTGGFRAVIIEWAMDQGFDGFVSDHGSVFNNLIKWLDIRFGK